MKIFISYSSRDKDVYNNLTDALIKRGHIVFNADDIGIGEYVVEKIKVALNDSDILIAVITENFLCSSWAQAELSSAIFSTNKICVLPIVVGDVFVPNFLMQFQYRKVDSLEEVTKAVINEIELLNSTDSATTLLEKRVSTTIEKDDLENKISLLKEALIDNQLTLVCGAGVSRDSSIPAWNELLINILNEVFSNDCDLNTESKVTAEDLLPLMPQSNLILGKYLKMILKDDFYRVVQKHLYLYYNQNRDFEPIVQGTEAINYALETNMMKAIVELARPKRRGNRLESKTSHT